MSFIFFVERDSQVRKIKDDVDGPPVHAGNKQCISQL